MPFVEVELADRRVAETRQHPHAAYTEDDFLGEAVPIVATVEFVRQAPVALGVLRHVGIEEQERHEPAYAGDVVLPGPDVDGPALDRHLRTRRERPQTALRFPVLLPLQLPARVVERLREVTLAMQQRDPDDRQAEVGAGPQRIPASTPSPPLYVGMRGSIATSIEG